jgi:hypothetical protein
MRARHLQLSSVGILGAILLAGLTGAAQAPATFKVRLSTVPISRAEMPRIQGSGSATATLTGTTLTITGTFQGLVTPATEANLHNAPKAMRGPVIFALAVTKATSGTLSGTATLTPQQLDALGKGHLYLQIHSEKAPEGNLRGWLLP